MKFFVIVLLTILSFTSVAEEKVKVISSVNQNLDFIPYLNDENVIGILKFGNDGQNALIEAINTPNSFFISTIASNAILEKEKLNFLDPLKELDLIGIIGIQNYTIAANYDSPFNSLEEMVNYHKENNKPIKLGGSSKLGTCYLSAKYIQKKYGVPIDYIQYKLGLQIIVDLKEGNIDLACRYGSDIHQQYESKMIKNFIKFSKSNDGIMKNIPTGFDVDNYMMLFANKNTDQKIKDKMVEELTNPDYLKKVKVLSDTKQIYFETNLDKSLVNKTKDQYIKLIDSICPSMKKCD